MQQRCQIEHVLYFPDIAAVVELNHAQRVEEEEVNEPGALQRKERLMHRLPAENQSFPEEALHVGEGPQGHGNPARIVDLGLLNPRGCVMRRKGDQRLADA